MNKIQKIDKFFNPRNIALIGGYEVGIIIDQLKKLGFKGNIWPVNQRRKKIREIKCFKNVNDLPGKPDSVFIAVQAINVLPIIKNLEIKENTGLVCYSAGFREIGKEGKKLEKNLKESLKKQILLGPNCYGYINYLSNVSLWPFPIPLKTSKNGIALITQSGMLSSDILMTDRSLPITHMVSVGNQLNIKIEDLIEYFSDLNEVKVIGLHVEGIANINKFSNACHKAILKKKPILIFKTGTSKVGKQLTKSHTGSLSGDEKLYDSLFKKLGVIKINDIEVFLETLKFISINELSYHSNLIAFTCSGGGATMIADHAEKIGLNFPKFKKKSEKKIKKLLPPIASVSNPLDYTTPLWGKREMTKEVFKRSILEINATTAILLQDYPNKFAEKSREFYFNDTQSFIEVVNELNISGIVCSTFSENLDEDVRSFCIKNNISPIQGISKSLEAINNTNIFLKYFKNKNKLKKIRFKKIKNIKKINVLNEKLSKKFLNNIGIKTPKGIEIVENNIETNNLRFPLVLKVLSNKIFHKTELGGIISNIKDFNELKISMKKIRNNFFHNSSYSFLLEEMAPKPIAELFFSLSTDPNFGKILIIGSGGIYTEILDDYVTLIFPITKKEMLDNIKKLKVSKIMFGYRNTKKINVDLFIRDLFTIIKKFNSDNELFSVEINPLFVYENGTKAVDAIIQLKN